MKVVLNQDTKVGRCNELVEMSKLFATLLLLRGKAKLPSEKGCTVGQLQWADIGVVQSVIKSYVKIQHLPVRYKTYPKKKSGLFRYTHIDNQEHELGMEHLATGNVYHLDSSKSRFSGICLGDDIVISNSVIKFNIRFKQLVEEMGWTPNTYLTKEQISKLEYDLNKESKKTYRTNIIE